MGALFEWWIPRSSTKAVVAASALVLVLIAGAAWLANARAVQSSASAQGALDARADAINIEQARLSFWQEREAMNEYLLTHEASILDEVVAEDRAFNDALGRLDANDGHVPALISSAIGANANFVSTFMRSRHVGVGAATVDRLLDKLDREEALVVGPLGVLSTLHERAAGLAEAHAAAADAQARRYQVAGILIIALATMLFCAWAIQLVRRIAERNHELRVADGLKNDFVASVSHELRTPLTSILGYTEFLLDEHTGPLNDEQRRFLAIVNRSSGRLLRLVGDLLFIAQLDATNLHLEPAPLSLTRLVEEAVDASLPAASLKDLTLTMTASPVAEFVGDPARLAQLLDNLLANAIKFTHNGGITVTLEERAGNAVIEVSDTGIGIPAADQARLFQRFYRTPAATAQAIQGSGLGLSIAKAIAEGHGGTIECESVEHTGTTFRVHLPSTSTPPVGTPTWPCKQTSLSTDLRRTPTCTGSGAPIRMTPSFPHAARVIVAVCAGPR
jgi:signal transduction histidine kinase